MNKKQRNVLSNIEVALNDLMSAINVIKDELKVKENKNDVEDIELIEEINHLITIEWSFNNAIRELNSITSKK